MMYVNIAFFVFVLAFFVFLAGGLQGQMIQINEDNKLILDTLDMMMRGDYDDSIIADMFRDMRGDL